MDDKPNATDWKQERFKRMKEAKLVRDSLLQKDNCVGVHIYKGHRQVVVRWKEFNQLERNG